MEELIEIPMILQPQSVLNAVEKYGKRLFGFIRSRVKTDEDAEDILQDVWYQLSSIIDTEPIEQLSSWLYRVSRNRIIDKRRKQKTISLDDLSYEDEDGEMMFPELLSADDPNPEEEFEKAYFMESLTDALSELPEKQREVFVWNELEGMTLQEIADKTSENLKTIISRKRYAVKYLQKRFQDIYNEY
jgi:RNA polymerase sigma factor (sigma-70 family)